MSTPVVTAKDGITPVLPFLLTEIASAVSSLYMRPDPIKPDPKVWSHGYVADVDRNAQHSVEHLRAAAILAQTLSGRIDHLRRTLFELSAHIPDYVLDRLLGIISGPDPEQPDEVHREYRVLWEIDILATSADDAVRRVVGQYLQPAEPRRWTYKVTDSESGETQEVPLT